MFSLETNAAIRSRLSHSLEVSSFGRYVAQQALARFSKADRRSLGIQGKERSFITFVETACLVHDLGNPPFGHFGELAISDWFHGQREKIRPAALGGTALDEWNRHYRDLTAFDGNPQGFRILTRLQVPETDDLFGLNLTATTLAATLKYPWGSDPSTTQSGAARKKFGYFQTEKEVVAWVRRELGLRDEQRHPLVYLMEAADDIAYCMSDIEDGIEKGIVSPVEFSEFVSSGLQSTALVGSTDQDVRGLIRSLDCLRAGARKGDRQRFIALVDFRSSAMRFLVKMAAATFVDEHAQILSGEAPALLRAGAASELLKILKDFAEAKLYFSPVVRDREITAHAVLSGLLSVYLPLMTCDTGRFQLALAGNLTDQNKRSITNERSLLSRVSKKAVEVYRAEVKRGRIELPDGGETVHRIRLIVDFISGMTDEFALQTFQLVSGVVTSRHRV